ncbi:hypothetical protein [Clostridium sp.]|uniref:hypothetical protein n=1 Tax=Clostridium sp. TaxID=1506 RepID=UPI002FCC735A
MRRISCILLIGFIFMTFNGCQNSGQASMPSQSVNKVENRLVEAVPDESMDTKSMTKLDEFSYDMDLDGSEERIELYTTAGRDGKGEMVWDDGQNWLLVVRDGKKVYPLLSEYVQLGSVYFTVSNNGVGEVSKINVIVSTGAGFNLKTYIFNKVKGGFVGETVYSSKDTNFVHTSIPGY